MYVPPGSEQLRRHVDAHLELRSDLCDLAGGVAALLKSSRE